MTVKKVVALMVSAVAASAIGVTVFAASSFSGTLKFGESAKSLNVQEKANSGSASVYVTDGINSPYRVVFSVYSADGRTQMSNSAYVYDLRKDYTMTYYDNCGFVGNRYCLKAYIPVGQSLEKTTVGGTWEA